MIKHVYNSSSCNRTPNSVDWNVSNKICYATCNRVAVIDPDKPTVYEELLTGHTDRVNCVKWIKGGCGHLVSGSADQTCIVWKKNKEGQYYSHTLRGHEGSINAVDAIQFNTQIYIVTASTDSTVKIWHDDTEYSQTLTFASNFILSVAFSPVPDTQVLMLACGGDDHKIHLFVEQDFKMIGVQTLCGHEDWVRGLQFNIHGSELRLASSSQDCYIRIWKFTSHALTENDQQDDLKLKETNFEFQSKDTKCSYAVTLESVLQGHDNWVYSVHWQPCTGEDSLCLLSASMDKTMIIWKPKSGLWIEQARVGEVGGNSLGLYGGIFSPNGHSILSHGYQGALQLYTQHKESNRWNSEVMCGGHFNAVQDIAWQPKTAHYLLSLSADQTTRCHGYWKTPSKKGGWYEVGRPQIHGYDMNCLTAINRYCFASGADEKVIRVFEAPKNFVKNLSRISQLNLSDDIQSSAEGASVPSLGLSNKAVKHEELVKEGHKADSHPNEQYPEHYFTPIDTEKPVTEVDLLQNTLWPEIHKLYGHGYEIFTLASNGNLLASACKASKAEHAGIMIWSCENWRHQYTLQSHTLTVTQLKWSHNTAMLLSVSRDRTWALYSDDGSGTMKRVAYTDKSTCIHTRIIWSCAWSHDDQYFITVSRDKKAVLWQLNGTMCGTLTLSQSITAVDLAPCALSHNRFLVAFGLENGCIELYTWTKDNDGVTWTHCITLYSRDAHQLTVKKLKFRPVTENNSVLLASCGADHLVRIYEICLNSLNNT